MTTLKRARPTGERHRSLTPSVLNEEAAYLRAQAATAKADRTPIHNDTEAVPRHYLVPAQGDPKLWAVRVKVWNILLPIYAD